jgi:hypothetical protein
MPLSEANPIPIGTPKKDGAHDMFLSVPFVSQRPYKNLSWAACGTMVLKFNHVDVSLSEITSKTLGLDCSGMPPPCDTMALPENVYKTYGFGCQVVEAPLSPQSVKACIANMQPVQVYFQWQDGSGHVVLITGYYENGDLLVHDPLRGTGRQTYRAVFYAYNRGTWQRTLYNFRRTFYVPRA